MKAYLVGFTYDHWNQGYEAVRRTALVYACSYNDAVQKVKDSGDFYNAHSFVNLTLV